MIRESRLFNMLVGFVLLAAPAAAQEANPLHRLNDSLVDLSRKLTPAVVQVISVSFQSAGEGTPAVRALEKVSGSGVIVSQDGYIMTNAHVIEGARRVQVQLLACETEPGGSKTSVTLTALVVGRDRETDLALLKVRADDLAFLEFADSDSVRQGQLVFALGNPAGLDSSITMGTISALARQLDPDDPIDYLQTDAPINPGNSGGPLVDVDGRVVGINTFIMSRSGGSEGLGFAIPSNIVRFVSDRLRKQGVVVRGDIGVQAQTITPALAAGLELPVKSGVILADVRPGGAGATAGLHPGDIVISVNGKHTANARQFQASLYGQESANVLTMELLRDGEKVFERVKIMERPDGFERLSLLVTARQRLIERLAVLGFELNPSVLREMPLSPRYEAGVLVVARTVSPYGPNAELMPGDIIYAVNRRAIATLDDLNKALDSFESGSTVILQLERAGRFRYVEHVVQ
jgi:serine protease Do